MSCNGYRQLLVLLEDHPQSMWSVLDKAVELADLKCARMTLAMSTDPGSVVRWLAPMALATRVAPVVDFDLTTSAGHRRAQAAEVIPAAIPLTTMLLGRDTARELQRVTACGCYDLLVLRSGLLAHSRRLRRTVAQLQISALTVCTEPLSRTELLSRTAATTRKEAPR